MMAGKDLSQVRALELFSKLTPAELDRLLQISALRNYSAGTILFREGDAADRFSVILKGRTEIILTLGTSEERVLSVLKPGDFLGEIGLLHPDQKRTASARVLTDSQHFEITKRDFESLIQAQPAIALRLAQEMSSRIHKSELATINELREKNQRLERAYQELQEAQDQLIEKEKIELELSLARKIQERAILHEIPSTQGWKITSRWRPARTVSGDFFDFSIYGKNRLKLLIADVTGKGVPAALVAATSRTILHTLMAQDIPPSQVMAEANNLLFDEIPEKFFVTCFYAEIDRMDGRMRYSNAGHCLPLWISGNWRNSNRVNELKATGMPLGALPNSRYDQKEVIIEARDRVFLYSDGLIEAHNGAGVMFGLERVMDYLVTWTKKSDGSSPISEFPVDGLLDRVAQFIGVSCDQEDDLTCLVIERNGVS